MSIGCSVNSFVIYACKFLHLDNHIRDPSARWDCMNTGMRTALQNTGIRANLYICPWVLSPPIQTHLTGVATTLTFCHFTPSRGFKPIVLNPDSQKTGTVGGLHNTSLSSLGSEAIFIQQKSWEGNQRMPCNSHYSTWRYVKMCNVEKRKANVYRCILKSTMKL